MRTDEIRLELICDTQYTYCNVQDYRLDFL